MHAHLIHETICGPCEWRVVNATSAPYFKGPVEISGSYGLGGDNAAAVAGMINVYISGGGCQIAPTALGGCQVGFSSPVNVSFGVGYGPDGRTTSFEVSLTWNGSSSDSCLAAGNGVCSETPGKSIRAQIVTALKLKARANDGATNLAPLWAKAYIEESSADTVIGGRCANAGRNLRIR